MIRKYGSSDFKRMHMIINDAAGAYQGVIPGDCFYEPYMSEQKTDLATG